MQETTRCHLVGIVLSATSSTKTGGVKCGSLVALNFVLVAVALFGAAVALVVVVVGLELGVFVWDSGCDLRRPLYHSGNAVRLSLRLVYCVPQEVSSYLDQSDHVGGWHVYR